MLQCHNHSVVWRSIADLIGLLQCIRILCDSAVAIGRCTGKVSECSSSSSLFKSWIEVSLSRISHCVTDLVLQIVSLTLQLRRWFWVIDFVSMPIVLCHWLTTRGKVSANECQATVFAFQQVVIRTWHWHWHWHASMRIPASFLSFYNWTIKTLNIIECYSICNFAIGVNCHRLPSSHCRGTGLFNDATVQRLPSCMQLSQNCAQNMQCSFVSAAISSHTCIACECHWYNSRWWLVQAHLGC